MAFCWLADIPINADLLVFARQPEAGILARLRGCKRTEVDKYPVELGFVHAGGYGQTSVETVLAEGEELGSNGL